MARSGQTLLEIVVVAFLIGLLASLVAPTLARTTRRAEAVSAARELRADLVAARTRAVLDGATVRVAIDTVGLRYRIVAGADTVRVRDLGHRLFLKTNAVRGEVLFTPRGTSSIYSTTWIGVRDDPGARWHGTRVAPTGAVSVL